MNIPRRIVFHPQAFEETAQKVFFLRSATFSFYRFAEALDANTILQDSPSQKCLHQAARFVTYGEDDFVFRGAVKHSSIRFLARQVSDVVRFGIGKVRYFLVDRFYIYWGLRVPISPRQFDDKESQRTFRASLLEAIHTVEADGPDALANLQDNPTVLGVKEPEYFDTLSNKLRALVDIELRAGPFEIEDYVKDVIDVIPLKHVLNLYSGTGYGIPANIVLDLVFDPDEYRKLWATIYAIHERFRTVSMKLSRNAE